MAGAHIAAATPPSPFPLPPTPRVTSPSSLPSSFPPRRTRTNHLRQKILKTLENKPYPDPSRPEYPPHQTHPVSVQETPQQDSFEGEQLLEPAGFVGGILGDFSTKSVAKIGLYLVGAFVFQTICAVLIFGSNDLFGNDENLDGDDGKENGKKVRPKKSSLPLGGNQSDRSSRSGRSALEMKEGGDVSVDESEMDTRITEIQEMARRAREQEKVEAKRKGVVEEEDDEIGFDMAVKMKEVDERLSKMRKSLEGEYQKPAPKDDGDSLMFKKKYKFKSPTVDLGDKPKGFNGTKDSYGANGTVRDVVSADDGTLRNDKKDDRETLGDDVESGLEVSVGKNENKEQEPRATRTESIAGTSKELEYDKQTSKSEKSGKSTKKPRGFGKESSAITTKHDDLNKNGSLKGVKGWTKKPARNFEGKFSTQTNFWWTSLPCVMAVTMQSGGNGEESKGLFIISSTSGVPHTVAFEDRSDATNFCYLLESFFEDLPNFSTNIIPIPTNELEEEVKLQKMKVVVVKKRQLKLYVGQPLEDVESALRALIESE